MVQDCDRSGAGYLIRRCEVPPEDRFLAKQPKGIGSNPGRCVTLGKTASIFDGYPQIGGSTQSLKRRRLVPPVRKIRIGNTTRAAILLGSDVQNAIIPVDQSKSLEEDSVCHCEDSGIDTDTESKCHNGYRRESGRAPHASERIPHIPQERVEKRKSSRIAALFLHLIESAELQACGAAGFGFAHSRTHVLRDTLLTVEAELGVQLLF